MAATIALSSAGELDTAPLITYDVLTRAPITIFADETCRRAAERMAESVVGRVLVVSREDPRRLLGVITRSDLLKARARALEEESAREGFLGARRARG